MLRLPSPRTLVLACLLAALTLFVLDVRGVLPDRTLRGIVGVVAGPVQRALHAMTAPARTAVDRLSDGSDEQRLAELAARNSVLVEQLGRLAADQVSQAELEQAAALVPASGYRAVPAAVVALSAPVGVASSATLSVGSGAGVVPGSAVIGPDGVVGVVDSVSPASSTVRLVSDAASVVSARVLASGEVGVLRGTGASTATKLTLLDPLGRMAVGDLIVTMGANEGRPFPAGLALGRVVEIRGSATDLSRTAVVDPAVRATTLDRVNVLIPGTQP